MSKLRNYLCCMSIIEQSDEKFMQQALDEAYKAMEAGEVPVGAVIVSGGRIIARAHNFTERLNDVTAHAEMQAFTSAAEHIGGKYLRECRLFVTLEPCVMCAGASFWTQISNIVYGAADPKRGYSNMVDNVLHPKTKVKGGVLAEECSDLLNDFFKRRRE